MCSPSMSRALGYPSAKLPGRCVRTYEDIGELSRGLKPRGRYSRVQKIAAVEYYLTYGKCLPFTRRAIGYSGSNVLKCCIQEFT